MIPRLIAQTITQAANAFFAISLVGPRQSGKTTLLRALFKNHEYINLEEPNTLAKIKDDPRAFLANAKQPIFFDEAQEYPELFSYLLSTIDNNQIHGQFILSGSQNFTLLDKISQSLAGRTAVLELFPLCYKELSEGNTTTPVWEYIYKGSYPGLYKPNCQHDTWYTSYIRTYIQRDVRALLNIRNTEQFYLFLQLCAGHNGQQINASELGSMCGVSHTTIQEWISVLETCLITYQLRPYYRNFNKRLVKRPKLFFYDTGIVSHLLGIESAEHAMMHTSRGSLFESFVIGEIRKQWAALGQTPRLYYWANRGGFEINVLMERGSTLHAIEIKSSSTFSPHFCQGLKKWRKTVDSSIETQTWVIYGGDDSFAFQNTQVLSYKDIDQLLNT